jgi:hypothetical protein
MKADHEHAYKGGQARHPDQHPGPVWKRLHRHWWTWIAVLLMLAAMVVYVLSDNEMLRPRGKVQQPIPAADGP